MTLLGRAIATNAAAFLLAAVGVILTPTLLLRALGITSESFEILALLRVVGVMLLLAGAFLAVLRRELEQSRRALTVLGSCYLVSATVLLAQQIAIWQSLFGICVTTYFAWVAAQYLWFGLGRAPTSLMLPAKGGVS